MRATRLSHAILTTVALIGTALVSAPAAHATTAVQFVIAPDGDDTAPGTAAEPFATLARAQQAVRDLPGIPPDGVDVLLRGGTHTLEEPLELTAEDSGTPGSPVRWRAWPGEVPVVDGGRRIEGWSLHDEHANIWSAPTDGRFRQLYADGVKQVRARTESFVGSTDDVGHVVDGTAPLSWSKPAGVELVYREIWTQPRNTVAAVAPTADGGTRLTMQQPAWGYNRRKGATLTDSVPVWIENDYSFLDQPGEWYLDDDADTVYSLRSPGTDPNAQEFVAPALERLLTVSGTVDSPVHDLRFEGLTFAHTGWTQTLDDLGGLPDVQGGLLRLPEPGMDNKVAPTLVTPSAVLVQHATDVTFAGNTFTELGNGAIDVMRGAAEVLVTGNHIHDIAGSGVQIGEVDLADGSLAYDETSPYNTANYDPADPREIIRDITVSENLITRIGQEYASSVGVFAGYTQRVAITHNEITDVPYSGISLGWGWGQTQILEHSIAEENVVSGNLVKDAMTTLLDGGGIYTLGSQPGTVIEDNHLDETVIGIYLDNGSSGIRAAGNVISTTRSGSLAPVFLQRESPSPTSTGAFANTVEDNFASGVQPLTNGIEPRTRGDNVLSGNVGVPIGANWTAQAEGVVRAAGLDTLAGSFPPAGDLSVRAESTEGTHVDTAAVTLTIECRLLRHFDDTEELVPYLDGGAALAGRTFLLDGGPQTVEFDDDGTAFLGEATAFGGFDAARGRNGASVTLSGELPAGSYSLTPGIGVLTGGTPQLALLGTAGPVDVETTSTVFAEDFSDVGTGSLPAGWSVTGGGGTASVQAASGGPAASLVIDHGSLSSSSLLAQAAIPEQTGRLVVEANARADQTDADGYGPWLRAANGDRGPLVAFRSNGTLAVNAAGSGWTSIGSYVADQWYRLKLDVDITTNTFELWVDGQRRATGIPFADEVDELSRVQFGAYFGTTGSFAFADLRVSVITTAVFGEDFADTVPGSLPTGWSTSGTGGTASVQVSGTGPTARALVVDHGSASSSSLLAQTPVPAQDGRFVLETRARASQTDADGYGPWLRDAGGERGPLVAFRANGRIAVNDVGSGWISVAEYTANEWYRVKLVVDVAAGSFDLWVDGELVAAAVPFSGSPDELATLQFGAYYGNTGTFAFTDIRLASFG